MEVRRPAARLRVAFLTLFPFETASTRQRIYKNLRFFPEHIATVVLPGITSEAQARLQGRGGGGLARGRFFLGEVTRKVGHLIRARSYDVVVVQKGLTVMSVRGLDRLLFALGRPVVFDFDDAVHLEPPQAFRWPGLRRIGSATQIGRIISRANAVVAGNRHLAGVASKLNPNVEVIATPMDTDWYRLRPPGLGAPPVVGWSGSAATNHYVARLVPILRELHRLHPGLEFRVISNDDRGIPWEALGGMPTRFVPFRLGSLVEDLLAFDVGLMPLHDDEWSRSKCGGKILQYMACGIPTVASPVGINSEIIEHGRNGFLAGTDPEWVAAIRRALEEPDLRQRMGLAARATVERAYCNRVTGPQLARLIERVAAAARPREPDGADAGS